MRTNRWASVIAGMSALYLVGCSTDRPTGVANAVDAKPMAFTVGDAAIQYASRAMNEKDKLFLTIPKLEGEFQRRGGIKTNLVNSPFDMNFNGGPVVTHSAERNVYINCPTAPSCWSTGNLTPATFLRDLDHSSIIQVANQYLHGDAFNRFRQITELQTTVKLATDTADNTPTATASDIVKILAGALVASRLQAGYINEYHLFFPPGTNVCIGPNNTDCYSPNNGATFNFCAFHSSIDFVTPNNDTLHTLFSVEPFQFVPGCVLLTQTRVIDGTASTLSHEFMETITDPDGDAWFSQVAGIAGLEIGDLCFAFRNPEQVGGHEYVIQEEYSNLIHACTDGAF
jgi:hypothetical protein